MATGFGYDLNSNECLHAGAYMWGALIEAGVSTVDTPASITAAGATKPAKQTKKRPAK